MLGLFILIIINGLFSMSEIAVVSARKARLQIRAAKGDKGAKTAIKLADQPDNFLATIQIGITLVAVVMGAFGNSIIAQPLQPHLTQIPVIGVYSEQIAGITAVILITYFSLVLGELAPKQIGLTNPETIASTIATPMSWLAKATRPLVFFLSASTRLVIYLLRIRPSNEPAVTEAEIQMMIEQGTEIGVVDPIEEEIVEQLFRVGDLHVNDLMVDRTNIVWFDINDSPEAIRAKISDGAHSRYPVVNENLDDVLGLVYVKDLLVQNLEENLNSLEPLLKPALFIPSGLSVYQVLEKFKAVQAQIALITDEHGGVEGLVTFIDLIEAIVGDVPEIGDPEKPTAVLRDDGSWLIDGLLSIEEFKELFSIAALPDEEKKYFQTIGGFVMTYLGHIPKAGEKFTWQELTIEVVDMDARRVDKVLVTKLEE